MIDRILERKENKLKLTLRSKEKSIGFNREDFLTEEFPMPSTLLHENKVS